MFSASQVVTYLLDKSLISRRDVLESGIEIVNASRRNLNHRVRVPGRSGLFVKQGQDTHKTRTLRHEARAYLFLNGLASAAIDSMLPRFYGFDETNSVLTLELIDDASSVFDVCHRTGRASSSLARQVGSALADLHISTAPAAIRESFDQNLEIRMPDALVLHAPGLVFYGAYASYGNLKVLQAVRRCPALFRGLDRLCFEWPRSTVVHGDLRWDNILLVRSEGRRGFKIVDWELATLGDPMWDVGCLFAEYLNFWLSSAPLTSRSAPEEVFATAQVPLSRLQPAIAAFWHAYVQCRRWTAPIADAAVADAVRYAAARLFQAAIEQTQGATSLSALAVFQLQLAANLIEAPSAAATRLFGLGTPSIACPPAYAEEVSA